MATRNPRISVTIAEYLSSVLNSWADYEGQSVSKLAGYLLEWACREAIARGMVPTNVTTEEKLESSTALEPSNIEVLLNPDVERFFRDWADKQGSNPSTLATFLVEKAVRTAIDDGLLQPATAPPSPSVVNKDADQLDQVREYLRLLMGKRKRNGISIAEVAEILDLDQADLAQLRNSLKPKEGDSTVEKH